MVESMISFIGWGEHTQVSDNVRNATTTPNGAVFWLFAPGLSPLSVF